MSRAALRLHRAPLFWSEEMIQALDRLAGEASRALVLDVSRSAVVRAAVGAWLADVARQPPQVVLQKIGAAARRSAVPLSARYAVRWPKAIKAHLVRLASLAARDLARQVRPGAVIRAAVGAWLADVARRPPQVVFEEIRAARVRRGRKARSR